MNWQAALGWRSDARDVTKWFDEQNKALSPDETNGRQMRRVGPIHQKFAKSRSSWGSQILSGFGITSLSLSVSSLQLTAMT